LASTRGKRHNKALLTDWFSATLQTSRKAWR
jgi:hypothetical protein